MGDALPFVDLGALFTVKDVVLGGRHTCAESNAGQWKCWGASEVGQTGLGSRASRGGTLETTPAQLPFVEL
jgi:hypothetical protein